MPSSHLILCRPLLLLPSIPPSIRLFSNESTLCMRWPKYWSFSFSISPSNEHPGLFPLEWTGWPCLFFSTLWGNLGGSTSLWDFFCWEVDDLKLIQWGSGPGLPWTVLSSTPGCRGFSHLSDSYPRIFYPRTPGAITVLGTVPLFPRHCGSWRPARPLRWSCSQPLGGSSLWAHPGTCWAFL